jgi:hypothetical protein
MTGYIDVDLLRPAHERWRLPPELVAQGRALLAVYTADFGGTPEAAAGVGELVQPLLEPDHWGEIEGVARQLGVPHSAVLVANLYYDALKFVLGCTAIAVDTPTGPLHARNLDWWAPNRMLAEYTLVTRFTGAPAGPFLTIGWPGFAGALSGLAPRRFAVTLNAVLSAERGELATPITFLLRTVLERARSYDEAVAHLARTPIASDCLLLVTGVEPGQMVVIERTPTRHALRHPTDGLLQVTNDYLLLGNRPGEPGNTLQATSCRRFERMQALLARERPRDFARCLAYLSDPEVRMEITVQQMAFHAASGEHELQVC